jgi:amidase
VRAIEFTHARHGISSLRLIGVFMPTGGTMPKRSVRSGVSRRAFLGAGAATGAALMTRSWSSLLKGASGARPLPGAAPWIDATIPQLQSLMAAGQLNSRELTLGYLSRIEDLNPLLHAVIETNPQAVSIAAQRDAERRAGHVRGPLHGIPVIVKDNIATDDAMQTTAGSLALVNSHVPGDAPIASQLRAAGAIILAKANLSEWANFRGFSYNGWSARGGFTRCPYVLSNDPLGSSSGSAVAAATNLASVTIGTETDGSINAPSHANSAFGIKPTVGRVPGAGIIPISHRQDTAGPITRNVTDAAILLSAISSPQVDFTTVLQRGMLQGKRLGMDEQYFTGDFGNPDVQPTMDVVLAALTSLGAEIVPVTTDPTWLTQSYELTALLFEFKAQIAEYLATLQHAEARTLADLMTFDSTHCWQEMKYFGQEIFEWAEATSGDLNDPEYIAARDACNTFSQAQGIDKYLSENNLDALIAPTWAWLYSWAAVAGYPSASLPAGYQSAADATPFTPAGSPVGFTMIVGKWQEAKLLGMMYDLEQELNARIPPTYLGAVPPEPPDAGICTGKPQMHGGTGKVNWRTGRRII